MGYSNKKPKTVEEARANLIRIKNELIEAQKTFRELSIKDKKKK